MYIKSILLTSVFIASYGVAMAQPAPSTPTFGSITLTQPGSIGDVSGMTATGSGKTSSLGSMVTTQAATTAMSNLVNHRAPTPNDDSSVGYAAGNLWNVHGLGMWLCIDATEGAAIWEPQATGILPLDALAALGVANAHGWGTRRLRAGYTGSPLQVTVGSTASDVPFDSLGNTDNTVLGNLIGAVPPVQVTAPSSAQMWSATVTTLYDQTSGVAENGTVPSGAVGPQISPIAQTDGSPFIGFASGGMNWLTDYTSTQNIQNVMLTTQPFTTSSNNFSMQMVTRNGAIGNAFNVAFSFADPAYPIAFSLSDILVKTSLYAPASLNIGASTGLGFQVPSTPSVFGVNGSSSVVTAFDDDNGSYFSGVNTTASVVAATATLTVPSTAGITVGQQVTMASCPAGTLVTQVNSNSTVNVSQACPIAETSVPVAFTTPALADIASSGITFGAFNTSLSGFASGSSAYISAPSLTPAQSLALRESLTDTFQLTPQVRDRVILGGDSVGAGADGWLTQAPIRHAETVFARPYIVYNTAIAGSQIGGPAPAQTGAFPTLVAPLYVPYALNVFVNEGGINSMGAGKTPAQTLADWQTWAGQVRALGPNVRLVGRTLEPHIALTPDSMRTTYNALLRAQAGTWDALDDEAASPVLGNPNNVNDRTMTVYGGGHTSPYFQSMAGLLMGYAINQAAVTWTH